MRYVEAKLEQEKRDDTYRVFVTDALKAVAENTARLVGGTVMTHRYKEISAPVVDDTDTDSKQKSQEIINRIKSKLKGGK